MAPQPSSPTPWLLGLCAEYADRWRLNPFWLRLAFFITALAQGVGIAIYLILFLLQLAIGPNRRRSRSRWRHLLALSSQAFDRTLHAIPNAFRHWRELRAADDNGRRLRAAIAGLSLCTGLIILLSSFGLFAWLTFWRTVAIVAITLAFALLHDRLAPPNI